MKGEGRAVAAVCHILCGFWGSLMRFSEMKTAFYGRNQLSYLFTQKKKKLHIQLRILQQLHLWMMYLSSFYHSLSFHIISVISVNLWCFIAWFKSAKRFITERSKKWMYGIERAITTNQIHIRPFDTRSKSVMRKKINMLQASLSYMFKGKKNYIKFINGVNWKIKKILNYLSGNMRTAFNCNQLTSIGFSYCLVSINVCWIY